MGGRFGRNVCCGRPFIGVPGADSAAASSPLALFVRVAVLRCAPDSKQRSLSCCRFRKEGQGHAPAARLLFEGE